MSTLAGDRFNGVSILGLGPLHKHDFVEPVLLDEPLVPPGTHMKSVLQGRLDLVIRLVPLHLSLSRVSGGIHGDIVG